MISSSPVSSSNRSRIPFHGHPPVCNVVDLLEHGETVLRVIRERGEGQDFFSFSLLIQDGFKIRLSSYHFYSNAFIDCFFDRLLIHVIIENEELVKLYESGQAGQHIPQGSIKSFRQYADYMTLSEIPIWPITPIKVSFFLLFRLLMGDVTNGTPLRNAYLRSLARSLEHYREETARYFLSRWPEAGNWIIRDGRGDPESRNDITHDILRICKQGQHRPIDSLLDFRAVQLLVTSDNPALTPDAWATRRRLSARWVRDRDSANLPERQYAGGKFIGEAPKPPPLSARSTHWNRHLHDLRDGSEETSWIPNTAQTQSESSPKQTPLYSTLELELRYERQDERSNIYPEHQTPVFQTSSHRSHPGHHHHHPLHLNLAPSSPLPYVCSPASYSSSNFSYAQERVQETCPVSSSRALPPITPLSAELCFTTERHLASSSSTRVLPSLTEAGLHPSNFPLPSHPPLSMCNLPTARATIYNARLTDLQAQFLLTSPLTGVFSPSERSCSSSPSEVSSSETSSMSSHTIPRWAIQPERTSFEHALERWWAFRNLERLQSTVTYIDVLFFCGWPKTVCPKR